MLYSATIPDYLFNTLLDDFVVDLAAISCGHSKRAVCLLGMFLLPSSHVCQGLKRLFTSVQAKKRELAEEIITPLEFKKGW
jgi:hypothetical protein